MSQISSEALSEAYQFIEILGKKYKEKIPKDIYKEIEKRKSVDFTPVFDDNRPISDQISNESLAIIAYLDLHYWANEEEKKEIMTSLGLNKTQEPIKNEKPFEYDSLFKKNNDKITESTENKEVVEYKKERLIDKIINKLKMFFSKK